MMRITSYKGREQMHKNKNYRIGIYIRVSTEEQAENPEGSIKNQEQRLRESIIWRNHSSSFGELAGVVASQVFGPLFVPAIWPPGLGRHLHE